jgi:hypothetical protein
VCLQGIDVNSVLSGLAQGPVEALFKGQMKEQFSPKSGDGAGLGEKKVVGFAAVSMSNRRPEDDDEEDDEEEEGGGEESVERAAGDYNKLAMSLRRGAVDLLDEEEDEEKDEDGAGANDSVAPGKGTDNSGVQGGSGFLDRYEGKGDDSVRSVATVPQRHSSAPAPSKGGARRHYSGAQSKDEPGDADAVDEEDGLGCVNDEDDDEYADEDYEAEIIESPMPRQKKNGGRVRP